MNNERPTINSAEPSKLSTISNLHQAQPVAQPQTADVRTSTGTGAFGGFKLPEYVKIIIYFALIFIPICFLMLWFINKGRKVSLMLDKTIQENENLQRQVAQLKTQNISLQRNPSNNNDSCCSFKRQPTSYRNSNNPNNTNNPNNNYRQPPKPSQYQNRDEPIVEQPGVDGDIDGAVGNINIIIDTDGNLYTSTGIFLSGPGLDGMGSTKHPDVRIEEMPDDDENGTPIDDFEEDQQQTAEEQQNGLKEVDQSEPLLDSEQEENQETNLLEQPKNTQHTQHTQHTQQTSQPQKAIPKMAPKGAPSKK